MRGDPRGDFTARVGKIVREPDVVATGCAALSREYGWQMRLTNFFSTLTRRIHGRALLELTLDG